MPKCSIAIAGLALSLSVAACADDQTAGEADEMRDASDGSETVSGDGDGDGNGNGNGNGSETVSGDGDGNGNGDGDMDAGVEDAPKDAGGKPGTFPVLIDGGNPFVRPRGSGAQSPNLSNPEAVVPPMCYTRTESKHNPCYVCHQNAIVGEGRANQQDDGLLQGDYNFSDFALANRWSNLFVDRSAEVALIGDGEIDTYVAQDNYDDLIDNARLAEFKGWIPDLANLGAAADAFESDGFARDGSGWVAFKYKPMPSTFWPTNGATDDVMIRLPTAFWQEPGGDYIKDIYRANLAIVEAAIKGMAQVDCAPINETLVGQDLDGNGSLGTAHLVKRPDHYVGAAASIPVVAWLYPKGTEFLHTVRYLGVADGGDIVMPRRMKEVRYMVKTTFFSKGVLGGFFAQEAEEKQEGLLPYYPDLKDRGLDNKFGWHIQGFIEDQNGNLRPNTYEEGLFCMGCHTGVGSNVDSTFSFARKMDGAQGWGYIDLHGMPDAPSRGETDGEILTYLTRVGGGSEFRSNAEMKARWFKSDGTPDRELVNAAADVYALLAPSPERARLLNKAYRVIVEEQTYTKGRDPTITPPVHVFKTVNPDVPPLSVENRHGYNILLDWR